MAEETQAENFRAIIEARIAEHSEKIDNVKPEERTEFYYLYEAQRKSLQYALQVFENCEEKRIRELEEALEKTLRLIENHQIYDKGAEWLLRRLLKAEAK